MGSNPPIQMFVAIALAVVLSGCTASAFPQSTAEEARPAAAARAQAWSSDATLIHIVGVEGSWSDAYGDYDGGYDAYFAGAKSDTHTDGRMEFWVFRYISADKGRALDVVIDADGKVVDTDENEIEDDDTPVGSYRVDSDTAVKKALAASDELAESQERKHHGSIAALGLDEDDGRPVWVIVGGAPDSSKGYIGGIVIIDARSGDVMFSFDFSSQGWGGDWSSYWGGYGAIST